MVVFVCPILYMFIFLFCQLWENLSEHVCLSVICCLSVFHTVCKFWYLIFATSSDERFAFLVSRHCALHCLIVSTHFYVVAQFWLNWLINWLQSALVLATAHCFGNSVRMLINIVTRNYLRNCLRVCMKKPSCNGYIRPVRTKRELNSCFCFQYFLFVCFFSQLCWFYFHSICKSAIFSINYSITETKFYQ